MKTLKGECQGWPLRQRCLEIAVAMIVAQTEDNEQGVLEAGGIRGEQGGEVQWDKLMRLSGQVRMTKGAYQSVTNRQEADAQQESAVEAPWPEPGKDPRISAFIRSSRQDCRNVTSSTPWTE